MKVIVRRVISASVFVGGKQISAIEQGLLLYVGFAKNDTESFCAYIAKKIAGLRIFDGANGEISIKDIDGGGILSISQFTLSAETKKGSRPSYINAMPSQEAFVFYEYFNKCLSEELGISVQTGVFGADMKILSEDDGPFTILFEQ